MQEGRVGIKPMPGYDSSMVLKEPNIGKKLARNRDAIFKIVAVVIILIVSFGILTSPWLSPISSIRDTDGDGAVDSYDEDWLNSSAWNKAYAKIAVSVTNYDADHNMSFSLYLNGVAKASGWIVLPMKSNLFILPVSWMYGDNSTTTFAVTIMYSSSDPIDRNSPPVDGRTVTVHPNDTIAVTLYY